MPAATVANNVEREALQTMYEMRGYAYTENTNFLVKGLQSLGDVKKHLQDAKDLAFTRLSLSLRLAWERKQRALNDARDVDRLAQRHVGAPHAPPFCCDFPLHVLLTRRRRSSFRRRR